MLEKQLNKFSVLGKQTEEKVVFQKIQESEELSLIYDTLSEEFKDKFIAYCVGTRGLPLTYDPFFKFIFDPETKPERLSRFLTLLMESEVKINRILSTESVRIIEEGSLLIMDIVVELENGSLANIEIQKIPYLFPGERAACYSSDLVTRQYSRVKKEKAKSFSYRDLKKVYTIILLEKSDYAFHQLPEQYIHRAKQVFNTGLEIELLQEYVFIPLDIFKKIKHNIEKELDAWLHCIASDEPEMICQILLHFPKFGEIYDEIISYRKQTKEVLLMFSEALKIIDRNTVQYMIDELQERIKEVEGNLDETYKELDDKKQEFKETNQALKETNQALKETNQVLVEKEKIFENRIKELEAQLREKQ